MRILLVSQMYPGPSAPDLGVFVRDLERALAARGHEIERAVLDSRGGGKRRYLRLARAAREAARAFRPDVVYAHFLVPTGLVATLAAPDVPLVLTAHGQDVANTYRVPGVRRVTRWVVGRAVAVVAVSRSLHDSLNHNVPEARGKTHVINCGVDLERFPLLPPAEAAAPAFLCVGSLTDRKNVIRLADAFAELGEGTLTFVGDGPLRRRLEGRPNVHVVGRVRHDEVARHVAQAHVVCQPSLYEPFGQAILEAMACGRSVVATEEGGPREFVTRESGVLVDPIRTASILHGLRAASSLPHPNEAARAVAERHDVSEQARRVEEVLARAARGRRA